MIRPTSLGRGGGGGGGGAIATGAGSLTGSLLFAVRLVVLVSGSGIPRSGGIISTPWRIAWVRSRESFTNSSCAVGAIKALRSKIFSRREISSASWVAIRDMARRRCKSSYSFDVPVNGLTVKITFGGTSSIDLGIVPTVAVADECAGEAAATGRAGAVTGATGAGVVDGRLLAGAGFGALAD